MVGLFWAKLSSMGILKLILIEVNNTDYIVMVGAFFGKSFNKYHLRGGSMELLQ